MRILIANFPWCVEGQCGVRAGSRWPFTAQGPATYLPFPFFLAYTASYLKRNGYQVKMIDAIAESLDEESFLERVVRYKPQMIIAETSTPSFEHDIGIALRIKERLDTICVCVGPHATVYARDILTTHPVIDYVLMGEYELAAAGLADALEQKRDIQYTEGVAYRQGREIRINRPGPTLKDLDRLPWPEREDVPLYNYNDGFCGLPEPHVQMLASRGCPFRCTFCLWPQVMYQEHVHRRRDPRLVIDELEWLIRTYDFKAVYFDDDTFNVNKPYVVEICNEIKKRGIHIPWAAMARADLMDQELLREMREAGMYAIKYGIESANIEILRRCKKNMDIERCRKIVKETKKIGIRVHLTFCLGLPGETPHTIQESLCFLRQVDPDSVQFSLATPFPGTELYNDLKQNNLLKTRDWSQYNGNIRAVAGTGELSPADLERYLGQVRILQKNSSR
ncbi:MAG: radical SAM protein [Candidatus Omnitrophica bacterium]|nr:radical SAM protein [Candidatus Omnitrophota bacterium]